MTEKLPSDMNRAELTAYIQREFQRQNESVRAEPLPRPPILDTPGADPTLRAQTLQAYAAACLDIPPQLWTPGMRTAIQEESLRVLRGMGR
jgi:hypothetical protein